MAPSTGAVSKLPGRLSTRSACWIWPIKPGCGCILLYEADCTLRNVSLPLQSAWVKIGLLLCVTRL